MFDSYTAVIISGTYKSKVEWCDQNGKDGKKTGVD